MFTMHQLMEWYSNPWIELAVSAIAAVVLMVIATQFLFRILRRLIPDGVMPRTVLTYAERPLRYLLPLIALQAVWNSASAGMPLIAFINHVNSLLLIATVTWLGTRCVSAVAAVVQLRYPIDVENNLAARTIATQTRVISRMTVSAILLVGASAILMTFPGVRQIGTSLLASAGVAGLIAGIAARPVLGNLIAGLQIALSQPIRIDDVLIVEGEWGRVEEIRGTYVVVKIWDERRLVVPLQWFIEHPFQNWTRSSAEIIGTVFLWVDYGIPLAPLRAEAERLCAGSDLWDKRLCLIQVTDTNERAMQLRILVTSQDASKNWDLRCLIREGLIDYIRKNFPDYLPTIRAAVSGGALPENRPSDSKELSTSPA